MENKKMDIVIIADFCSAFDHKGNNRFIYLSDLLIKRGHDVEIITSDFYHGTKTKFEPIISEYDGAKVTMLEEKPYPKNVCIKRFVSHYLWGKKVYKYLKSREKKPDIVYCAIPTLKAASLAGKYCNKNNIKFIIDIQDLWPEAYKMVFNVPVLSSIVFAPFNWIANSAYKKADGIIAVSQTYVDRAMKVNKKVKSGHAVFLGTDLETFDKNVKEARPIEKSSEEIWLGYCGTLGASYDLKVVFDAIRLLNNPCLRFVIMGDGPDRKMFEDYSKGLNVTFMGRLSYKEMCGVLSQCDFVVNPIKHNAAQSIINKHADYSASGKPIINTQECKEYRDLVNHFKMGLNCENGNLEQLTDAIAFFMKNKTDMIQMGLNSRKCGELMFNRSKSYDEICNVVLGEGHL